MERLSSRLGELTAVFVEPAKRGMGKDRSYPPGPPGEKKKKKIPLPPNPLEAPEFGHMVLSPRMTWVMPDRYHRTTRSASGVVGPVATDQHWIGQAAGSTVCSPRNAIGPCSSGLPEHLEPPMRLTPFSPQKRLFASSVRSTRGRS